MTDLKEQGGDLVITGIGELATPAGTTARRGKEMDNLKKVDDAAVVISGGRIVRAGPADQVMPDVQKLTCPLIDAEGGAVVPGFIDPHTHFVFAGDRADEFAWRLEGISYQEIMSRGGGIVNTVKSTRTASPRRLYELALKRLDDMLGMGVTTVEGKSGYGLDKETELFQLEVMQALNRDHPVDIVATFMGAHALPPKYEKEGRRSKEFIDFLIEKVLPEVSERNLAEFCDVFCEEGAFSLEESRRILKAGRRRGLKPKIHADEMTSLGGAELAAEIEAVSAEHLLKVTEEGIDAMAKRDVTAVLLPLTAFSLREDYAPARRLINKEVPVALATDFNPGSSPTQSLPLLIASACLYMDLTPAEALTGATLNAAAALDRAEDRGSIEPGKRADLLILKAPSYRHLPYRIGTNIVDRVIKDGRVVQEN